MNILYVEDEDDIREIAEFVLDEEGIAARFCASGKEAIQTAKEFAADVVVLDVMMPEMDGPEVMEKLRELVHYRTVPIIFLTAKVRPKEIQTLLDSGAVEVLAKPFNPITLLDQIRSVVERERQNRH